MGQVRNTIELINKTKGKINAYYDIGLCNIEDIKNKSKSESEMIINGYIFGYAQGIKAEKAKNKNKQIKKSKQKSKKHSKKAKQSINTLLFLVQLGGK